MTVRAFIFVFTVLGLGKCAFGLQCYCKANMGFLPHCWDSNHPTCTQENSICYTFIEYRRINIYVESACWNKDIVLTWESLCAEPLTRCCNTTDCNQKFFDDLSYFPTTDMPTTPPTSATEPEFSSPSTRGTQSGGTQSGGTTGGTTEGIDRWKTLIISSSVSLSLAVIVIVTTLVVIVIIYSLMLHRTDKVAAGKQSQPETKLSIDMDSKCVANRIPPSSVNHMSLQVQQV